MREYERTGVLPDKIIAFELKITENEPPRHIILEVYMEYPRELHDRDDDYPMAPEIMAITPEITGPKQHELRAKYFATACPHSRKLICSIM